jgi:transcriptional regulator with XRE-family HTH domain
MMVEKGKKRKDYIYTDIGYRISLARNKKGLSQEFLASECGLERTSIIHIEKGRQRVPIDRLYDIAAALGIDIKELLPDSNTVNRVDPISRDRIDANTAEYLNLIISGLPKISKE